MKNKIIAGAAVIALGLLVYFMCGDSNEGTDRQSSLLVSTSEEESAPTTGGETTRTYEGARDGEDADEEGGSKNAAANTASFFLSRERQEYTLQAIGSFRKMSVTTEMTGQVISFAANSEVVNVSDQSKLNNVISILLPNDVSPGTYNEKSQNFMVQFFGQEAGTLYNLDHNCAFTLTVDEWGGPGGRARGTFSGELKADGGSTIITVTDGRFEAGIQ